jgi:anti-sigma regulatory factor (Ser/Thr protein kinase)
MACARFTGGVSRRSACHVKVLQKYRDSRYLTFYANSRYNRDVSIFLFMKINLPNSAFLGNIDPFLRKFDASHPEKLDITANKKWISVHPVVLSMIAALGLTVDQSNIQCEKFEAKSAHYFQRMGLFKFLNKESGITVTEHEPAGRFVPLTQIKESGELTRFVTDMIPLLHLNQKQAESISHIITELVRNVLEHSGSKNGAILCAQYYPKSNSIRLGIVDTGVGIKKTINFSYPAKTDLEAIQLALVPGITGTTRKEGGTEYNAGAGLFLIKSIASVNRDFFMIYSGHGMYKLLKRKVNSKIKLHADPLKDKHSKDGQMPYWQGTAVGIDISLDNTQEFSLLLDYIWETYKEAIKERKKAKYKKARFI